MNTAHAWAAFIVALLVPLGAPAGPAFALEEPLRICATTPDLGSIAREIGGDRASVTVFARGVDDPHFVEAKPAFIKAASQAELFVVTGMELESGWAPPILQSSRNAAIQVGQRGYLDASAAIAPLERPSGVVDRSMGDVHAAGNPHYLLDPVNGLRVARLLADRLGSIRTADKPYFDGRFDSFRARLCAGLVGEELAQKYDAEKLARLAEAGKLLSFLKSQEDDARLSGWLGDLSPYYGSKAVADHNLWPYFAKRYGIEVVAFLEPKPGIPPTTKHLQEVVQSMQDQKIRVILSSPYFDPHHVAFVADRAGARVVGLAHLPGSRPGTDDYVAMCDYNAKQLAAGLKEGR
jgi:ABC-type Zn uptake system ZnuABC Zn-binding protein ZnuA